MKFVPNTLTFGRIAITPVILILLLHVDTLLGRSIALLLFILAAISDYWDGRLARSMGVDSRLGKFLDPMADKVLVLGTFAVLSVLFPRMTPWWAVSLIAFRDVSVTSLRIHAEMRGQTLKTIPLAKTKTTVQLVYLIGILLVLVADHVPGMVAQGAGWVLESIIPYAFLLFVVAFTLVTGFWYFIFREYCLS